MQPAKHSLRAGIIANLEHHASRELGTTSPLAYRSSA